MGTPVPCFCLRYYWYFSGYSYGCPCDKDIVFQSMCILRSNLVLSLSHSGNMGIEEGQIVFNSHICSPRHSRNSIVVLLNSLPSQNRCPVSPERHWCIVCRWTHPLFIGQAFSEPLYRLRFYRLLSSGTLLLSRTRLFLQNVKKFAGGDFLKSKCVTLVLVCWQLASFDCEEPSNPWRVCPRGACSMISNRTSGATVVRLS